LDRHRKIAVEAYLSNRFLDLFYCHSGGSKVGLLGAGLDLQTLVNRGSCSSERSYDAFAVKTFYLQQPAVNVRVLESSEDEAHRGPNEDEEENEVISLLEAEWLVDPPDRKNAHLVFNWSDCLPLPPKYPDILFRVRNCFDEVQSHVQRYLSGADWCRGFEEGEQGEMGLEGVSGWE
jgi:hypothetical protein